MRETLSAWDEQLIEFGTDIIRNRQDFIDDVSPYVHQAYERIAGVAQVNIRYKPSSPMLQDAVSGPTASHDAIHDALLSDLNARVDDEFRRGVTLVGPHRDELELELDGFPVKGYASHGESWSMALALRLGAADVLRADGVDPIIILDDVFAELDQQRRRHLTQMVHSSSQVFITAAVEEDVPKELDGARFAVVKGQVSRA